LSGAFLRWNCLPLLQLHPTTSTNPQKSETYECGIPTEGLSWLQFNVGYFSLFANYLSWYSTLKQFSFFHGQSHEGNRNEWDFIEIVNLLFVVGYWFTLCLEERSIEMGIKNMKEKDFRDNETLECFK